MSSLGQKHRGQIHLYHFMAGFDTHSFCARCRDKGEGPDPCISKSDCQACHNGHIYGDFFGCLVGRSAPDQQLSIG